MLSDKLVACVQAQKDRLAFIDLRVRYLGGIRRTELVSRFGIQMVAATRDIALYKELASNNLAYNSREKIYERGEPFEPVFDFPVERVLTWISQGYGDVEPCRSKPLVLCEFVDIANKPNLDVLSVVTRAIHRKNAVEVVLHGSARKKTKVEMVPFALANSADGWLVRAYDRQAAVFCDFALTRILEAQLVTGEIHEHEQQANDIQWNRIVMLELVPHPANNTANSCAELDYGMKNGRLKVSIRASLVGYFLRHWCVDCSEKHVLKGPNYRLWLGNRGTLFDVENLSIAPGYVTK
jgi:hypothetical protein